MSHKSNQKRQEPKPSKKSEPKQVAVIPNVEMVEDENQPRSISTSLNEELDEHLKKNSKRFFGGCG